MNEPLDPRATDRLWAIFCEWKDGATPDTRAHLDALGPNDIQISGEVDEGRATIYVSAMTDGSVEPLMKIDGAKIGLTVVGGEIVSSSDD